MGEQYVRPPLVPREAPPAWRAVWRFRLGALLLLALLVLVVYRLYQEFSGATDQDPGLSSLHALAAAVTLLR
jgi:hypothetical protein